MTSEALVIGNVIELLCFIYTIVFIYLYYTDLK